MKFQKLQLFLGVIGLALIAAAFYQPLSGLRPMFEYQRGKLFGFLIEEFYDQHKNLPLSEKEFREWVSNQHPEVESGALAEYDINWSADLFEFLQGKEVYIKAFKGDQSFAYPLNWHLRFRLQSRVDR